MASGNTSAIGRNLKPVAIGFGPAEANLVIAVGINVHLGVIENTRGVRCIRTVGRTGFHRERGVDRTGDISPNDVFVVGSDWRLEVHSVGVVPCERTSRRHDAIENRALRIEFLMGIQRALKDVGEIAESLGHIVIGHDRARNDPFVACLLQQCH
ncbi:unannotated protein [freshwater metagenome]|uniref:Unannotated protein n=1 Tax=freshwater metagenome TaxID=449393 RepID=A0A6J6FQ61_9ZZZZ